MSWTEIISLILNLVLGGGFLVTIVTLKQTKQKAQLDIQEGNVRLINTSVKDMLASINSLTEQNNELVERLIRSERTNKCFAKKITVLEKKLQSFIVISEQLIRVFEKVSPQMLEKEISELKELIADEKKNV
jgi:septal ring factor EnvC (AmiA/AmiB activator)